MSGPLSQLVVIVPAGPAEPAILALPRGWGGDYTLTGTESLVGSPLHHSLGLPCISDPRACVGALWFLGSPGSPGVGEARYFPVVSGPG